MGKIQKAVFIKNAVETLGYFSGQIALEFEKNGVRTYFVDCDDLVDTVDGIYRFAEKDRTAFVTFNFVGISGEEIFIEKNGRYLWENYGMPCLNILVDHPLYYHSKLENPPLAKMHVFCIDREHVAYMRRFYPEIPVKFLPLAGNVKLVGKSLSGGAGFADGNCFSEKTDWDYGKTWNYKERLLPYEKRRYDVVFTGNYTPVEHLYREIERMEPDYQKFYRDIMEDLTARPGQSMDKVMEAHIKRELGEAADSDKRSAIAGMVFIDICVRSYFRGKIIRDLAESGVRIHVFGANWEQLSCKRPENIISTGREVDSRTCVEAVRNAKISLNIMPWFKDGAHDRVFTAMLQETVSLTDDSRYLREQLRDGEDVVFFSLKDIPHLTEQMQRLLTDGKRAARIAECGYQKANKAHTWRNRALELLRELDKI